MADRPYRGWWTAALGGVLACLAACTAPATEATEVGPAPAAPAPVAAAPAPPASAAVRVLHLNLCNSGIAGCYSGRSIAEAAAVIRAEVPDLVTLNEVCEEDVDALEQALAEVVPGGAAVVASAFRSARDRDTGEAYRCRNGQEYGNGVVSRWPAVAGSTDSGVFPAQDPEDPEERSWVCLDVTAGPALGVCTTHLAYTDLGVTIAQCGHLFGTVVPARSVPVVVGADLNLGPGDNPQITSCVPPGSARVDDGGPQHVVGTPGLVVDDSRLVDLRGTTDHPGLLVTFAPR